MAPARTYLLLITLLFLTLSSYSISVGEGMASFEQNKKILGSRPPGCVNKCVNCRPCEATLVIPPHPKSVDYRDQSHWDDNYYLLSWKCKCGDKIFQP